MQFVGASIISYAGFKGGYIVSLFPDRLLLFQPLQELEADALRRELFKDHMDALKRKRLVLQRCLLLTCGAVY